MKARLPDGYGKQNVNKLMQQAQEMQQRMEEKQAELEEKEFPVKASGGMVEVTIRGDYNVVAMHIDPQIVDPEDVEMMEDMVAAAVNEAIRTVKETTEQEMNAISEAYPGLAGLA